MRIVKIPTGEYYIQKSHNTGLGYFIYRCYATQHKGGSITLNSTNISVPRELVGKRLMFRVEVVKR